MSLSTLILLIWVFFVSIWARGWATDLHVTDIVFWVGIAFVIVRVLEALSILNYNLPARRARA